MSRKSAPATVEAYLAALPEDRRQAISSVRAAIRKALPKGYVEGIQYGMIGYYVPHALYPSGYHCDSRQPLPFASLASQKSHMAIYLFCTYLDEAQATWFRKAWLATGKRLDMGKSCVRFKRIDDVPLEVVAEAIRRVPVKAFIEQYERRVPAARATREKAAAATAKRETPSVKAGAASTGAASNKKKKKKKATATAQSSSNRPAKASSSSRTATTQRRKKTGSRKTR